MPTNLNTNKNANDLTKKLWEKHQADEFTHEPNERIVGYGVSLYEPLFPLFYIPFVIIKFIFNF